MKNNIIIYQAKSGEIEFRGDIYEETLWANLQQIADLFETDKSGISRHIKNIYDSQELNKNSTVAKIATVQIEGNRKVSRDIEYYNLDLILSVGYRVNSKTATKFRQWATKTLRQHIIKGYTINKTRVSQNYDEFLRAIESVKKLLPTDSKLKAEDTLELVNIFAKTWFSLDAYDKSKLPKNGATKRQVKINSDEVYKIIDELKKDLIKKGQATNLFAQETTNGNLSSIIGNIFQSFNDKELYSTIEDKAVHLLYFIVKDHPFIDGNKRSGAFVFSWFLNKYGMLDKTKISPEALTAITILVAESKREDKERIIGLLLQVLMK